MRTATLCLMLACAAVRADSYRFDMGSAATPTAPGYTQVTAADRFGEGKAYGWAKSPAMVVYRNEPTNPWYAQPTSLEYTLYSDGLLTIEENTFTFRVKPGRYAVTAVIGDLALGEGRPGNSIWANGMSIVGDQATNASVKAYTFPIAAHDGLIELRFRADSLQQYVTVEAVSAEPLAEGQDLALTVKQYPEAPVTADTYRRNWAYQTELLLTDWTEAKRQLAAEGVDLAFTAKQRAAAKGRPGYREYWGWSIGSGGWERMAALTGELDLAPLMAAFIEMGIDGFSTRSESVQRQLHQCGLKVAVSGSAEGFPARGGDTTGITLNLMKTADGSTTTVPRVWSNMAPEAHEAFREVWRSIPVGTPGPEFFLIDEPRGMWYSGGYGDHSPPAQEAFRKWCAAQGYQDLANSAIPDRGRTMAFYRFYQFRLNSVPIFMTESCRGTALEKVMKVPGNGDVGPEQMNHSNVWPPAYARAGMATACWSYGTPAAAKMHAETIRIAEEHGGQAVTVPPQYPELHSPVQDRPLNTAGISALNTRVMPWHFRGPVNGPDRIEWMKNVVYSARLTHATSGLTHTPPLFVWCPESIVFNDLVELNRAEAENWKQVQQALFDANLDYAVTNTLAVPPGSTVLYACVRPVLSDEELAHLQAFLGRGGTLLCAFAGAPERPDGQSQAGWAKLPAPRLPRIELTPAALNQAVAGKHPRNWSVDLPELKTCLYQRDGRRVHLLNNTGLTAPATFPLPAAVQDALNGKMLAKGATLTIPPGLYALVEER